MHIRSLTLTIGNRGRALRAGGVPISHGRLNGTKTAVTLVGHLTAVVRVLAVAVGRLLAVANLVAESLGGLLLVRGRTRRRASTAARLLAALVVVNRRLVFRRAFLLDGPTRHAALHDVTLREIVRQLRLLLLLPLVGVLEQRERFFVSLRQVSKLI